MVHSTETSDPPKCILDEIVNPLSNQIFAIRGPYSVNIQKLDKRQIFNI